MSVTFTFEHALVSSSTGYGAMIKATAQRGANGKVYTASIPWDATKTETDTSDWIGVHADGEWHMWANVIPVTIRAAICEGIKEAGPRILEENRELLEAELVRSRQMGADTLNRRIAELRQAIEDAQDELRKFEAGERFNPYAGRAS